VTGRLWNILPKVLISCLVVSISLNLPLCWHTICSRHQYEANRLGFGGGVAMAWECDLHGKEEKCIQDCSWKICMKEAAGLGVDMKMIIKWIIDK